MTRTLEELTGATEVNAWTPDQSFADLIIDASFCGSKLSGVITALNYDLAAGNGDVVGVRYSPVRTAQGPIAACSCLSHCSSTLNHYTITIRQYGDYDDLCGFSLYEAGPRVRDTILNNMANALATQRDALIWAQLVGFKPTIFAETVVACNSVATETNCCAYRYAKSLYNSIVSVAAQMRHNCRNPTDIILDPTVAKWFAVKDYTNSPGFLATFGNDGVVSSIDGLNIIWTGNATACNGTSHATMAVVIDRSRAIGEVWGMRPTFSETYVNDCNYYKDTIWEYWGTARFDVLAIAHIRNP